MKEVLTNNFGLFYMVNPVGLYGLDKAKEFSYDSTLYEEKIKYFTKKYANPNFCNNKKEYTETQDFTYN